MNLRLLLSTSLCALTLSLPAQVTPPTTPPALAPPAPAPIPAPPRTVVPPVIPPSATPAPAPRPSVPVVPRVEPEKAPAAPAPVRDRERTIYVPYEELEKIFTDSGKGVFLPYKEFLELWNELNLKRAKEDEAKPPQDGVVSKAEYVARVEGETLIMDTTVTVESFKKGWLTVPLAKGETMPAIADAQTGDAVLRAKEDGYDVLLPDKGRYELKLKIYAPIRKTGGKQMVTLALPQAAVSRFTATVPQSGWGFTVDPAAAFTSRPAGENTELSFFFGSGGNFDVAWSKPEAATELKPLVLASSQVSAEVRAGSLATELEIDFRILRAPVSSFSFLIPAGQEVLSVTGDDVKDFKLEPADANKKLTVTPNAPVRDEWSVTITLEAPLPKLPAEFAVPDVTVLDAAQDRGEVSVVAEPQLDVTPRPAEGMVQQTQSGTAAAGLTAVGGYRFLKRPAGLTLGIAEAKPQVDVSSLTLLAVRRDSNRVESTFNYNIRRVGIFEARVALPAGWTNWEIVGLPPDAWTIEKRAAEVLVVRFPKQTLGQSNFTLRGTQQRASATEDVTVPVFTPESVSRHEAKVGVGVHSSLELTTKTTGDLKLDDVTTISSMGALSNSANRSQTSDGIGNDTELTLALRYRDAVNAAAVLSFKAREPQVNVDVLTLVEAKEQSLRHTWTLAFNVAYAATDRFVLAVPKEVAADIRLVDTNVKEILKNYQATPAITKVLLDAANYELWEVVLRSDRIGEFSLSLNLERPLPSDKTAKLELLPVHVPTAFQERGQVAVVKEDALEIRGYTPENLEEIDPSELRGSLARGGVFLAFKSRAQAIKLALDVTRNAYIPVPQAVVTHAVMTAAISSDRAQTIEMIYWVRNNSQQFLTVKLPKGTRLVSDIFVDGGTQQPMKREGSDDLLVRLPGGSGSGERSVPVRFVYEVPSAKAGERMGAMGSFTVEPPELANVSVVLESHAQLYLPDRLYDYTSFNGPMEQSLMDRGWGRLRRFFDPLLPSFGPQLIAPVEQWKPVPAIPENQKAAFDFKVPEQGVNVKLHRLGPPAPIDVGFRARKMSWVLEGLAFLAVVVGGILWLRQPLARKVLAAAVVGVAAVVLTGLVSPVNGAIVQAAMLGLLAVVVLWLLFALPQVWRALMGLTMRNRLIAGVVFLEFGLLVLAGLSGSGGFVALFLLAVVITLLIWGVANLTDSWRSSRPETLEPVAAVPQIAPVPNTATSPPADAGDDKKMS